jgi:hypothetical protein
MILKLVFPEYCIPYLFDNNTWNKTQDKHIIIMKKNNCMGKLYKGGQCNQLYSELSISSFMLGDLCISMYTA